MKLQQAGRTEQARLRSDRLARRLVEDFAPERVLDAGCGSGLLVEALRRRGVSAVGIDPDESAFIQADPAIRPHLRAAPLTDPLDETYDLILCLEALDGDDPAGAHAAVSNLARGTDEILFSPQDGDASDPAFWPLLFAAQGFFRDVDYDASFVGPKAARFRRADPADAVQAYERRFLPLWEENAGLRERVEGLEAELERLQIESDTVSKTLAARLRQWETIWADVERSAGWKFIHRVRVLRMRLAPPGTRRAALLRIARDSLVSLQDEGLGAFFRHWGRGLVSRDLRTPAGVKHIDQVNAESYPDFVARTTPSPADLERQRAENRAWKDRPLISFLTPVYKPPVHVLRAAIESVLAQSYEGWELCLADASPDAPEVRELLAGFASRDPRIRVQFLYQNLGIAGNSNAALAMATGEYVAILDHDDVLAPHMLHEVVRRIRTDRFADVVYFDEDKLSEDGAERRDPFFKPDFSPEMLVSANYLTHAVYRRSLVEAAGGFDPDYEGCQDWDLAFKVTERTREVAHIPQVLYHWRQVSGSTAGDFGAKSYVFERQLACVRNHLERSGLAGVVTGFPVPGFLHARWPASGAKVSIVIPTRDQVELLSRTIRSLREVTAYPAYELILVDNGSEQAKTRRYLDNLRLEPDVRIVDYAEKFNYSRANNLGAAQATGEILLFLNNDVEILHPDWLEEMVRWADRPEVGVVGAKLLYPDRTIQHAGVIVGMEGHASHVFWGYRERQSGPFGSVDWYRNFTAVTGACMMVRRGTFEAAGGFDEKYILAFSDIEFCMRVIGRGLRIVYTPHARLVHFEGKSRGDHIPSNDIRVGLDDFMPLVERGDPFYNPNLSYVERKPMIRPADEEDRVSRLLRVAAGARVDDLTRT